MAKVLEFKAKNVRPFTSWLKKFSSINNSLLLEVDKNSKEFIAKTHNEEKSVVKYSRISFEDAGLELKTSDKFDKRIRVGIYHIPRLIKSIDQFVSGEFTLGFKYDEIIGENAGFAGIGILLKNPLLKMNVECTSLHIFKYISDDVFMNNIANQKGSFLASFEFPSTTIEKIESISDLDSEYEFVDFKGKDGNLFIRGKSFELKIAETKEDSYISIYKAQFSKVDVENYITGLMEDRLVFKSKDSETITVISMAQRDEKYDESATDF